MISELWHYCDKIMAVAPECLWTRWAERIDCCLRSAARVGRARGQNDAMSTRTVGKRKVSVPGPSRIHRSPLYVFVEICQITSSKNKPTMLDMELAIQKITAPANENLRKTTLNIAPGNDRLNGILSG